MDTSENLVESEDEEEVLRLKSSRKGISKATIAEGSATSKIKGKGKGKGKAKDTPSSTPPKRKRCVSRYSTPAYFLTAAS